MKERRDWDGGRKGTGRDGGRKGMDRDTKERGQGGRQGRMLRKDADKDGMWIRDVDVWSYVVRRWRRGEVEAGRGGREGKVGVTVDNKRNKEGRNEGPGRRREGL